MRIAMVSWEFPPAFGGGIGTYVAGMASALARRGHVVTVVTVTDGAMASREVTEDGVRVVRLPMLRDSGSEPGHTLRVWTHRADEVSRLLRRMTDAGQLDVIEFADYRGEGFAYLQEARRGQRPPVIVRLHTPLAVLNEYNRGRTCDSVLVALENRAMRDADHLLTPSRALEREVRRLAPELSGAPCDLLPYTLDERFVRAGEGVAADGSGREILYVGRFEERKGVLVLAEALGRVLPSLPGWRARLVGGDTPLSEAEPSVCAVFERVLPAAVRDRVTIEQAVSREELLSRYAGAGVCVFPSLFENFPNVCLEAMLLRRCVIGGSNSGMAEMLEDGRSGLLAESGSAASLEAVLRRACAEMTDADRAAMGEAARARALAEYQRDRVCEAYESLCAGYIARSAGGRAAATTPGVRVTGPTRVAAVLPCYNHGAFLAEAIASVRAQTRPVQRIIVVDDGSTDPATVAACEAQRGAGVEVIRQKNQGLAAARNTGVRAAADCDVYVPLDSDDTIAPTFVEKLLAPLEQSPALGYSYCWAKYFGAHEGVWHCPPFDARRQLVENHSTATALIRREAFDEVGGYKPDMVFGFEDWDFWLSLIDAGWGGRLTPEPLFHYRKHAGGSMLSRTQERRAEMWRVMVSRHERMFARLAVYAVVEKDTQFFRDHMDLWALRDAIARGAHATPPPPADEPAHPDDQRAALVELKSIEGSRAWRAVVRLKDNPLYAVLAEARWGPGWRGHLAQATPQERLAHIRLSRSFRAIQSIKRSGVYQMYRGFVRSR